MILATSKLDSISNAVSSYRRWTYITNGISEDHPERQQYDVLKEQIRQKTKKTTDSIDEEQKQFWIEQGRNEIIKKLVSNSPAGVT